MSPEARLLEAIDAAMGLVAAERVEEHSLSELTCQICALSQELSMPEAAAAARELDRVCRAGAGSQDAREQMMEALARAADDGLRRRFSGNGPAAEAKAQESTEFLYEAREHLDTIERELLILEQEPGRLEAVHAIFRGFHTIKGLAAVFECPPVRDLAHEVETLLDGVRNGLVAVDARLVDICLQCSDALRAMLNGGDSGELAALTARIQQACGAAGPAAAGSAQTPLERRLPAAASAEATVRVETAKLDQLVDMVGELVIAQSMVESDAAVKRMADPKLARNIAAVARMASQLQRTALGMRLVTVGPAFHRLARAFRDLARQAGKKAHLRIEGEGIELDRTILEQIADPLLHMIRNAVDHGLESPSERAAAGKAELGQVKLAAAHRAGHILIEVSDDGRGLDQRRILERAVERKLVAGDAQLSPSEVLELIFEPGFSTAEKVTDLSGRGVGMDVVRKQIEKLRGRVEIRSSPGAGTSFLLRLPLTLAIIDGLLVRVEGVRYVLPLFAVREMFRPRPDSIVTIEGRGEAVMLRGRAVAVVRVAELLGRAGTRRDAHDSVLIATDWNGRACCLMVDAIEGKQELVIKSLGEWFGHMKGISGGAILNDGTVGLILDPEGLLGGNVYGAAA